MKPPLHLIMVALLPLSVPAAEKVGAEYVPSGPVKEGVALKQECAEPGLHFVGFMFQTPRRDEEDSALEFKAQQGPVRAHMDEQPGVIERINPYFGYALDWRPGRFFFCVSAPGTYELQVARQDVPNLGKVQFADVETGRARKEDFERKNLLVDGGFEGGCPDFAVGYSMWQNLKNGSLEAEYALDRKEFCEGRQSLRMVCKKGLCEMYSVPLPVRRGARYRCSLSIKGGEEPREFRVDFQVPGGNPEVRRTTSGFVGGNVLKADATWQKLDYEFAIPAPVEGELKETVAMMRLRTEKIGTYWMDAASVSLVRD